MKKYPVEIEIPIAWGEMDAFKHLNNVHYFRYFESSRVVYVEQVGFLESMQEIGVGPILAETSCKYKFPLEYPDRVSVGTKLLELSEDRFLLKHRIWSLTHERVAAEGEALVVSYNYKRGEKAPVPESVRERILEIEKE